MFMCETAQSEQDGALYCVVLLALRRFVWGSLPFPRWGHPFFIRATLYHLGEGSRLCGSRRDASFGYSRVRF
ncbi:hypothetical protein GCM10009585_04930 [Brevibacterium paucivorans]